MLKNRPYLSSIGGYLRAVRRAAGISQSELAARADISRETVMQAEAGRGSCAAFRALAAALDHEIGGRSLPPGEHLGARLRVLRQRRQISVRSLAALARVSPPTIAAIELGRDGHLASVDRLGGALGAGLRLDRIGDGGGFWAGAGTSSAHHGWATPPDLLARLYPLVGGVFDLDPCSPGASSPVRSRIRLTAADDGLSLPWIGSTFVNPPYGRGLLAWVRKAREEAEAGRARPVIGLVPARPDTRWWHDHVANAADVVLLKGRLRFGGGGSAAPFPSALIAWAADETLRDGLRQAFPEAWHVQRSVP